MNTTPFQTLLSLGQSPWLDFIDRVLITSGKLSDLIEKHIIQGVTSNPTIFQKALTHDAYDDQLKSLASPHAHPKRLFEALAIRDIQQAADDLRPVYEQTQGTDGFVSFEISPFIAGDTNETLAETKRLWRSINRPNLMMKIPACKASLIAVKEALIAGINVNVTLIFSAKTYKRVQQIYFEALEERLKQGKSIHHIASVASLFISRIDVEVNRLVDCHIKQNPLLKRLRNKMAIATATSAYHEFTKTLHKPRFKKLQAHGARPQRLLWASVSPKEKDLDETFYVRALHAPYTVVTLPLKTLKALAHTHLSQANPLKENFYKAAQLFRNAKENQIDMDVISRQLFYEGLQKFQVAFRELLSTIDQRQHAFFS